MPNVSRVPVRWIAVAAGVALAAALSLVSPILAVVSLPLVVGAAIERHSGLAGRVLMRVGAGVASVFAGYPAFVAIESVPLLKRYHDFNFLLAFALSVLSFLLVVACDVLLVADAIRKKTAF